MFEPCISCSLRIYFTPSLNFNQMFSAQRQCSEPITQPCGPSVKVKLNVTSFSLAFPVLFISPLALKGFSLNFNQLFSSQRKAEPITQPCRPSAKVTIEGQGFKSCISVHKKTTRTTEKVFLEISAVTLTLDQRFWTANLFKTLLH